MTQGKDVEASEILKFLNSDPEVEKAVERLENDYGLKFNDIDYEDRSFPEGARLLKAYSTVGALETENHSYAEGIY